MSTTPTTGASRPQYMAALEGANKVRTARAKLKRRVADGEVELEAIILNRPSEARNMTVADLLMSQSRWGVTRSRKMLAQLAVSETKCLGSMTDRQCQVLAALLASGG
jgi:ribosomal protein L20